MTRIRHFTFTIRDQRDSGARTEFEKRVKAMLEGAMYPRYTTQSYVYAPARYGQLMGIGIVETEILFNFAVLSRIQGVAEFNHTTNASFQHIAFDELPCSWFDPATGWHTENPA